MEQRLVLECINWNCSFFVLSRETISFWQIRCHDLNSDKRKVVLSNYMGKVLILPSPVTAYIYYHSLISTRSFTSWCVSTVCQMSCRARSKMVNPYSTWCLIKPIKLSPFQILWGDFLELNVVEINQWFLLRIYESFRWLQEKQTVK